MVQGINFDPSNKVMAILPAIREQAIMNKRFGKQSMPVEDFRKLLYKFLEALDFPRSGRTLHRIAEIFYPFGQKQPSFIDGGLLKVITINNLPDEAVYDILFFHHCWRNPLLRSLLEHSFYPFMVARARISRERIMDDIEELVGKYNRNTVENAFYPLTKHGFMVYDKSEKQYDFTYRTIHPLAFLYVAYRELERLKLKVLGVHRIDNLSELDFTKWMMLKGQQISEIARELDNQKLAEYSFQVEEQLHIKYTFNEFISKLGSKEEGER